MEYKIIRTAAKFNPHTEELEELVNNSIKEGWTPLGGPMMLQIPQRSGILIQICQAVTK